MQDTLLSDMLDDDQLAVELGVTTRTVQRWRARRIGPPFIRIGRRILTRRDAARQWMLDREQEQPRARGAA